MWQQQATGQMLDIKRKRPRWRKERSSVWSIYSCPAMDSAISHLSSQGVHISSCPLLSCDELGVFPKLLGVVPGLDPRAHSDNKASPSPTFLPCLPGFLIYILKQIFLHCMAQFSRPQWIFGDGSLLVNLPGTLPTGREVVGLPWCKHTQSQAQEPQASFWIKSS